MHLGDPGMRRYKAAQASIEGECTAKDPPP